MDEDKDNMDEDQVTVEGEKEMSFLDHLEELRWHIVRSFSVIILFAIVIFFYQEFVFKEIIFAPTTTDFWTFRMLCKLGNMVNIDALCFADFPFELQSRQMMGQFMMSMTVAIVGGIVISFPYLFFEIWRFVSPGLYANERQITRGAVFYVSFLFLTGISFGYFIMTPIAINFFANYSVSDAVKNQFDITNYVTTTVILVFGSGVLFQLPIVTYFLAKVGLVTPELMRRYRKHAIVVIFILGAMITPPDPFTQIFIALPLIMLYQLSIVICKAVVRGQQKQEKLDALQRTNNNE